MWGVGRTASRRTAFLDPRDTSGPAGIPGPAGADAHAGSARRARARATIRRARFRAAARASRAPLARRGLGSCAIFRAGSGAAQRRANTLSGVEPRAPGGCGVAQTHAAGTNVENFGAEVAFCSPLDWLARPIQNATGGSTGNRLRTVTGIWVWGSARGLDLHRRSACGRGHPSRARADVLGRQRCACLAGRGGRGDGDGGPGCGVHDDAGSQGHGERCSHTATATAAADSANWMLYAAVHGPWPGAAPVNSAVRARPPGSSVAEVTDGGRPSRWVGGV
jgi:hypothetical protein